MTQHNIEIRNYSSKSFAVFGDTKPLKETLRGLKGSFNPRLTHPETGEKTPGWIFSQRHYETVCDGLQLHNVKTTIV